MMIPTTGNEYNINTDERLPVSEMSDRALLEEIAQNLRTAADGITAVSGAVQSEGIMGLAKGLFTRG